MYIFHQLASLLNKFKATILLYDESKSCTSDAGVELKLNLEMQIRSKHEKNKGLVLFPVKLLSKILYHFCQNENLLPAGALKIQLESSTFNEPVHYVNDTL